VKLQLLLGMIIFVIPFSYAEIESDVWEDTIVSEPVTKIRVSYVEEPQLELEIQHTNTVSIDVNQDYIEFFGQTTGGVTGDTVDIKVLTADEEILWTGTVTIQADDSYHATLYYNSYIVHTGYYTIQFTFFEATDEKVVTIIIPGITPVEFFDVWQDTRWFGEPICPGNVTVYSWKANNVPDDFRGHFRLNTEYIDEYGGTVTEKRGIIGVDAAGNTNNLGGTWRTCAEFGGELYHLEIIARTGPSNYETVSSEFVYIAPRVTEGTQLVVLKNEYFG